MKKFQELVTKDLGWKLLSIAIAATMWFMVINITQPVDTRSYSRFLTLENMDTLTEQGLTLGNAEELKNMKITVKVKAQRTALDRLQQNPDWISVSVDLSELTDAANGETVTLPVDASILQNGTTYTISSKAPATVEAKIETLRAKEFPIEVKWDGKAEDADLTLSAESVTVSGPASLVRQVATVKAVVEEQPAEDATEARARLICYDYQGTEVTGVSLSIREVTVSFPAANIKQVPILADVTGTPASGYQVSEITCAPAYAQVQGAEEALKSLSSIQLDSIDVSGRTTSVTKTFSLKNYLPEGVAPAEDNSIEVTVSIAALEEKTFTLDQDSLTVSGQESGKTYTFDTARVTVSGSSLSGVRAEDLNASVSVNGLSAGTHRVSVRFDLPDDLRADPVSIEVTVAETGAAEEND